MSTTPQSGRDELLRELSAAVAALEDLPPESFSRRVDLRDHILQLRAALADPTEGRTARSLRQELDRLEGRLDQLHRDRPIVAAMAGAGEGGGDGLAEAAVLARTYDQGRGRSELEQRIADVRRALDAIDEGAL